MKDLYTFDINKDKALETYQQVSKVYETIFQKLKLSYIKVNADNGTIGGDISHEYHIKSKDGEDTLISCNKCNYAVNIEKAPLELKMSSKREDSSTYLHQLYLNPTCKSCMINQEKTLSFEKGIEIFYVFYLDDKYSKPMNALYQNDQNQQIAMNMGCYGIGLSRLMAALINQNIEQIKKNFLLWPYHIAAYKICIIIANKQMKDYNTEIYNQGFKLYDYLMDIYDYKSNDIVIDDRNDVSIGYKIKDSQLIGYPITFILGKNMKNNQCEIQYYNNAKQFVTKDYVLTDFQYKDDILTNIFTSDVY